MDAPNPPDFRSASSPRSAGPSVWRGEVPPSWGQGRATFGGLVGALALRPMLELVPPERWLRSLHITFVRPLASAAFECHANVLREGRALTTAEARVLQDGAACCVATAAFASDRPSSLALQPGAMRPEPGGPGVEVPFVEGLMPAFFQHFVHRWDNAAFPGSGSPDAHVIGACRFKHERRAADVCDVLGLMDAWPPAPVTMLKAPASAASTVSWSVSFPSDAWGGATDEPWSYEVRATSMRGGFGTTAATLWDPSGRLVALSTQLVTVYE